MTKKVFEKIREKSDLYNDYFSTIVIYKNFTKAHKNIIIYRDVYDIKFGDDMISFVYPNQPGRIEIKRKYLLKLKIY